MRIALLLLAVLPALPALAAAASPLEAPLKIRNVGPIANLYGLPRTLGAHHATGVELTLALDWGNTFSRSRRGNDEVFLDGETVVSALLLRGRVGERWEWGAELPYVRHRQSDLDHFIDEFHHLFGFPEGGRELAPQGALDYLIFVEGTTYADFNDPQGDLGDPRLWLGRSLYAGPQHAGMLRVQVKLPLGDVETLTGSEATDVAVWWEHDQSALFGRPRLGLSAAFGAAWLGDGELVPQRQNHVAGLASLGLRYQLAPWIQLNLQADYHGAPVDTDLGELHEDGFQGTIGGRIRLGQKLWLDLGVVENLNSRASPDAVFLLHLSGRW